MASKTTRDLERWVEEHERALNEIQEQMEEAQQKLEALRTALAISRQKDESEPDVSMPKELANKIYEVLAEAGEPLHYGEIHDRIRAQGIEVPGKDPKRNVNAHLSGDTRFEREGRGYWKLKREGWRGGVPPLLGLVDEGEDELIVPKLSLRDRVRGTAVERPISETDQSPWDDLWNDESDNAPRGRVAHAFAH